MERHGLSEELVTIADQGSGVDYASFDGPKASAAGCITQISLLVGRSYEHALSRLDDFFTSVARPLTLNATSDECLEESRFRAI